MTSIEGRRHDCDEDGCVEVSEAEAEVLKSHGFVPYQPQPPVTKRKDRGTAAV
jgi:hypothetical protein